MKVVLDNSRKCLMSQCELVNARVERILKTILVDCTVVSCASQSYLKTGETNESSGADMVSFVRLDACADHPKNTRSKEPLLRRTPLLFVLWFGRGMRADLIHIIILQLSLVEDELRISFPSHPSPRGLVS
jgi:hypothetical protein